jgi:hypothetical protein
MQITKRLLLLASLIVGLAAFASVASADTVGKITFEPSQGYVIGDINGQQGWMKTNPAFDVKVVNVSAYPAAANSHFGTQAPSRPGALATRRSRLVSRARPARAPPKSASCRLSTSAPRSPPCSPACTCRSARMTGTVPG